METDYEKDFTAWALHNAQLLKEGKLTEVDQINIAEELESMGKSQHLALINRLVKLLAHLLKWEYQPNNRTGSWRGTITEQRRRIQQLLETSPSLKYRIEEKEKKAYVGAVKLAAAETGLPQYTFPKECPYTLNQILDDNFYP